MHKSKITDDEHRLEMYQIHVKIANVTFVQFKVDTQDEAIKTLTSAKERLEKEKHKLGEFLGQKSDY